MFVPASSTSSSGRQGTRSRAGPDRSDRSRLRILRTLDTDPSCYNDCPRTFENCVGGFENSVGIHFVELDVEDVDFVPTNVDVLRIAPALQPVQQRLFDIFGDEASTTTSLRYFRRRVTIDGGIDFRGSVEILIS
jgi:hypothetical protein